MLGDVLGAGRQVKHDLVHLYGTHNPGARKLQENGPDAAASAKHLWVSKAACSHDVAELGQLHPCLVLS